MRQLKINFNHISYVWYILSSIIIVFAIIALIVFNSASIAKVNNQNLYAKDSRKSKQVQGTLIALIFINVLIILYTLFRCTIIYKLVKSDIILRGIIVLLKLAVLITGIIGIVYFKSMDIKSIENLKIGINHTNINTILAFTYMTFIVSIISSIF
jgi:hypothetical protein